MELVPLQCTVKSQIFVRYLIIPDKIFFCLEAIEFQCNFVLRLLKIRKVVRTNQFQVKSTKISSNMTRRQEFVSGTENRGKENSAKRKGKQKPVTTVA